MASRNCACVNAWAQNAHFIPDDLLYYIGHLYSSWFFFSRVERNDEVWLHADADEKLIFLLAATKYLNLWFDYTYIGHCKIFFLIFLFLLSNIWKYQPNQWLTVGVQLSRIRLHAKNIVPRKAWQSQNEERKTNSEYRSSPNSAGHYSIHCYSYRARNMIDPHV